VRFINTIRSAFRITQFNFSTLVNACGQKLLIGFMSCFCNLSWSLGGSHDSVFIDNSLGNIKKSVTPISVFQGVLKKYNCKTFLFSRMDCRVSRICRKVWICWLLPKSRVL